LRRQADQYIELADIAVEFTRKPTEARESRPRTTREDDLA